MTGIRTTLSIVLIVLMIPMTALAQEEPAPVVGNDTGSGEQGQETWTVNLKEADIRALVNQVADITGYSFVVDPRVQGEVTVISDQPMNAEAIYDLFLTVLQVHGFTAVPGEDVIRVVQQSDAKQSAEVLTRFREVPSEQLMTEVVPVENVSALQLVPILRPMVASYGHLAGVAEANALLISDHRSNIERLKRVIRDLDRPTDYEMEVIQLQEAWVGDVVELLEQLGPGELGDSPSEGDRTASVVADERSNRLILRGTTAFRETVRDLIHKLDQPATSRGTTRVIRLNHADATSLADLLQNIMGEIAGEQENGRSGDAAIFPDEGLNALVVRAEPGLMNEVEFIVEQLDVRRAQVLIEAAIVEVSDDVGRDLGVQWAAGDESGRTAPIAGTNFENVGVSLGEVLGAVAQDELIAPAGGVTIGAGQRRRGGLTWGVLIQALSTSNRANLLSTPSIITLDNEESEIIVGQNVPFRTGQATQTGDGLTNPFTTIERQDIGLTLRVTPSISDDDVVRLAVEQTTEDISASVSNAADLITNKREIKTSVLADDGETIVLGGLITEDYRTQVNKVPLLGDIPVLGALFRSESRERTKQNLLVFLRPTILREKGDSAGVADRRFNRLWQVNLGMHPEEDREDMEQPEIESLFDGNPMLPSR